MRLLYNFGINLFLIVIHFAAFFNKKAKKWVAGRKNWRKNYRFAQHDGRPTLWIHVSSLGEFEQGRPVIEEFKTTFPDWRVVLTFFSPSGYEVRKNYPLADAVLYLPADTAKNARDFLEIIQPDAAVFVKYDFWFHYLTTLKKRNTPTLLVSALFRPGQPFFKWYGGMWREMLHCFSHIFVQNKDSETLLQNIGCQNVTVAGDTRVDRVLALAAGVKPNENARDFSAGMSTIVAGSTWPPDEEILFQALGEMKLIIAPHEPSASNVAHIESLSAKTIRYSKFSKNEPAQTLIIDNVGMLNTLYQYGKVAYIGGGFGKGIHNTLEPAAFGLPIIFGPKYEKFEEARQFVARGGAIAVKNKAELVKALQLLDDPTYYQHATAAVTAYLNENRGATEKAIEWFRVYLPKNKQFTNG